MIVTFQHTAERELVEAVIHYEENQTGLGGVFFREVELGARQIAKYPSSARLIRPNVRRLALRRFPYSLCYSMHGNRIRILAVSHDRRRPFYWDDMS